MHRRMVVRMEVRVKVRSRLCRVPGCGLLCTGITTGSADRLSGEGSPLDMTSLGSAVQNGSALLISTPLRL